MKELPLKAKFFIISVIFFGTITYIWQLVELEWHIKLLIPACLAAILQVFKVEGVTSRSTYNLSWILYGFTWLLLGTPALLFVILIAHLVEWVWHKYPWYIQVFNIASYALVAAMTHLIIVRIDPSWDPLSLTVVLGFFTGLIVFTILNHLLIGLVIWLARGQDFKKSGVFGKMTLLIDFTMIGVGATTALLWSFNPLAIILNLMPLYLIYRALEMPALQRQSETDPKTKLYNARYFKSAAEKEFNRAQRFERPLTIVLGDLDLLRTINNTYGHLAGDVVLCGVAEVLENAFRGYDIVSRFGGEEFGILLPETTPEEAFSRVEAVRVAIGKTGFEVETSVKPITATMSFGIASLDDHTSSLNEILHNADLALFQAKLSGRNLTRIYSNGNFNALLGLTEKEEECEHEVTRKDNIEAEKISLELKPHREKAEEMKSSPSIQQNAYINPRREWKVNAYIGFVALVACGLSFALIQFDSGLNWFGLIIFVGLVLLAEGLSVEIFVKDVSISTSAIPFIAGIFLFGPIGVFVLSIALAVTNMIKKRSPIKRLLFNLSNHLTAGLLCAGLITLVGNPSTKQPSAFILILVVVSSALVFISTTALLSGVLSLQMNKPALNLWKVQFGWLFPYYLIFGVAAFGIILAYTFADLLGVIVFLVPMMMLRVSQIQYIHHAKTMVTELRNSNKELESQRNEINNLNEELLHTLAHIIDLRDPDTSGHSEHVADYAALVARNMSLPKGRIEMIRKAAMLHDIGKLGIPEAILLKCGALTQTEFNFVKQHTSLGADILEKNNYLNKLIPVIRHHHERYDGKGYPDGLSGQEIPIEARIVCLADAIEAMASDRPYRKAMDIDSILEELRKNAGTQFDPEIVVEFIKIINNRHEILIVNSARTLPEIKISLLNYKHLKAAHA